jgi:hypothetical protein
MLMLGPNTLSAVGGRPSAAARLLYARASSDTASPNRPARASSKVAPSARGTGKTVAPTGSWVCVGVHGLGWLGGGRCRRGSWFGLDGAAIGVSRVHGLGWLGARSVSAGFMVWVGWGRGRGQRGSWFGAPMVVRKDSLVSPEPCRLGRLMTSWSLEVHPRPAPPFPAQPSLVVRSHDGNVDRVVKGVILGF